MVNDWVWYIQREHLILHGILIVKESRSGVSTRDWLFGMSASETLL
jgi:hypothetical protein